MHGVTERGRLPQRPLTWHAGSVTIAARITLYLSGIEHRTTQRNCPELLLWGTYQPKLRNRPHRLKQPDQPHHFKQLDQPNPLHESIHIALHVPVRGAAIKTPVLPKIVSCVLDSGRIPKQDGRRCVGLFGEEGWSGRLAVVMLAFWRLMGRMDGC